MVNLTEEEVKGLLTELMKIPAMYSLNSILFLNRKLEEAKRQKDVQKEEKPDTGVAEG